MSGGGGTVSTVGCKSVPAVDQHGSHVRQLCSGGPADKSEDGQGVLRDPHVGPLGVMILKHRPLTLRPRLPAPLPTLHGDKKQREEEGIKALNVSNWEKDKKKNNYITSKICYSFCN